MNTEGRFFFIPLQCLQIIKIISALTTLEEHRRLVRGCESYFELTLPLTLTPELFRLDCFRLIVIHQTVRGTMAAESVGEASPAMVSTIHSPGEGQLLRCMMRRGSEKSAGTEGS